MAPLKPPTNYKVSIQWSTILQTKMKVHLKKLNVSRIIYLPKNYRVLTLNDVNTNLRKPQLSASNKKLKPQPI